MKRLIALMLTLCLALAFTSCGGGTSPTETTEPDTSKSEASHTQEDSAQTDTTAAQTAATTLTETTVAQNDDPDDEDLTSQEEEPTFEDEETEENIVSGVLYAVFSEDEVQELAFGYEEDTCTPEKIAYALSELTGLSFEISSEFDSEYNAVIVDWSTDSTLATGQPAEFQNDDFRFYDEAQLRFFMLNSLCRSIRENMGNPDVFYTLGGSGDNMNNLDLDLDFNPSIAYNKIDDARVLG